MLEVFVYTVQDLFMASGLASFSIGNAIMIVVSILFVYLAIAKKFEPLLLLPIAFGVFLANLPNANMSAFDDGLMGFMYLGLEMGIFPPLIFLGVGAMTDFGPLIASPKSFILGAAAQVGIFLTFIGAMVMGFTPQESASIGIIGSSDGPTTIFTAAALSPHLLSSVAIAAYSYMALVPIIQPPIMRLLTTKKERSVVMGQLRPVSKTEKLMFPIFVSLVVALIVPQAMALVGMLMLGNLIRESGVTDRIAKSAQNELLNLLTVFLALSVGASARAENFLTVDTLFIIALGLVSFGLGTASGVLMGKVMCRLSGWKVNPLIGSAGVSALPMAARVSHKVGQEAVKTNYLMMHAMGPTVSSIIGSAVVAGVFISILGS